MSENWGQNSESQYGRSYGNSNFRGGQRREGGNGGYGGQRSTGGGYGAGGGGGYGSGGGGYGSGGGSYGSGGGGYGNGGSAGGYGQRSGGGGYGGGRGGGGYGGAPRQNYGGGGGGRGGFNNFSDGPSSNIEIDSNKVGIVIGRGGAKIREIQDNFKVHVKIDREAGQNGYTGVTIRGDDTAIENAKTYIQELVAAK